MPAHNNNHLRRELGFWTALTIGAGTMIGAGIFLLSGVAIQRAGPAAVLSYVAAGAVCIITAASAAELATGMPTSGGGYYFVSRAFGPAFGAISGVGIWLSLTFAIAFYLFGLGEYVHEFLPLSPLLVAVISGILLTALNVAGAKESGGTQITVVFTLIGILVVFIIAAALNVRADNWAPFFPNGAKPIYSTTALIFISFLGFVKIAAVSEEIKDPSRNLPRSLIGSVLLVSLLYILIVLVISGLFSQAEIVHARAPLTLAAETMFGRAGRIALIFAGLLATLSSANASIMAASRINLAMSRDRMIPHWLCEIHPRRLTPYRAILLTGALSLLLLSLRSLEALAEIASVLQLITYAALNIGCLILRTAEPEWYRPTFRVPATPYVQFLATAGCVAIILFSDPLAQAITVALIAISLAWYFLWSARRVDIQFGLPLFRDQWAALGWRALFQSSVKHAPTGASRATPAVRIIEINKPRRVMVALANPKHEADLLRLGRFLATGRDQGGAVCGVHLVKVPIQTPLSDARARFTTRPSILRAIAELATVPTGSNPAPAGQRLDTRPLTSRPIYQTVIRAVTDVAHDVFGSLVAETSRRRVDLLLLGWHGGFNVSRIYNSPVQRILANAAVDVGVLKNQGLEKIESILVPWGGGPHAQLGLEFAARIGQATGAAIDVLRVVNPGVDVDREQGSLTRSVETIIGQHNHTRYRVEQADNFADHMLDCLDKDGHDLVIIGASHEWRIRNVLFGSIPDLVADHAGCSVLMVRRYLLAY